MLNRAQWLAERRKGIGGTDAAAILGLSPWRSPMDVFLDKTGRLQDESKPDPDREILLEFGSQVEAVVANIYSRVTGRTLRTVDGVVRHPEFPMILGSPDRLVVGERRGVEIKSEIQFSNKFGDPGTDEIPEHYAVQCMHYMAIVDADAWDLALLHGGLWRGIYTIPRDRNLEREMLQILADWWQRHVVADIPPEIDGSDGSARYLAQKFERNVLPIADAGSKEADHARELVRVRGELKTLQTTESTLVNLLKAAIGEREGIRGDFGRITWKRTKDSVATDFEAAFSYVAELAKLSEEQKVAAIQKFTTPRNGVRRFLLTPAKG